MRMHMTRKAKAVFVIVALLLFLIPGIGAVYSGVHRAVYKLNHPEEEYSDIVFAAEYPFEGAEADMTTAERSTVAGKYLTLTNKLTGFIEDYSGASNLVSPFFLNLYGRTAKLLGKNLIDDAERPVIKLENGCLTYVYSFSQEGWEYEGIPDFYEWLTEKGISFLYIEPAEKSDERYADYPKGFPGEYGAYEDNFIRYLGDNGIPYINSSELLISENEDFYSWFYKTDHHWNVHAGFLIASAITERLKTEFGLPVDGELLDRTGFRSVTYENAFLGSQGKKTTRGYISPENFEVYYPLFDTEFFIEIPTMRLHQTGSFENTLLKTEALKKGDYYSNSSYTAFLYGDFPVTRIHNMNCKNGTRALMLKTSDANVVDTYLAFAVEYLDIIDPRHFDGSIRTFIEMTQPDVVLTCAYPSDVFDDKYRDIQQSFGGMP